MAVMSSGAARHVQVALVQILLDAYQRPRGQMFWRSVVPSPDPAWIRPPGQRGPVCSAGSLSSHYLLSPHPSPPSSLRATPTLAFSRCT